MEYFSKEPVEKDVSPKIDSTSLTVWVITEFGGDMWSGLFLYVIGVGDAKAEECPLLWKWNEKVTVSVGNGKGLGGVILGSLIGPGVNLSTEDDTKHFLPNTRYCNAESYKISRNLAIVKNYNDYAFWYGLGMTAGGIYLMNNPSAIDGDANLLGGLLVGGGTIWYASSFFQHSSAKWVVQHVQERRKKVADYCTAFTEEAKTLDKQCRQKEEGTAPLLPKLFSFSEQKGTNWTVVGSSVLESCKALRTLPNKEKYQLCFDPKLKLKNNPKDDILSPEKAKETLTAHKMSATQKVCQELSSTSLYQNFKSTHLSVKMKVLGTLNEQEVCSEQVSTQRDEICSNMSVLFSKSKFTAIESLLTEHTLQPSNVAQISKFCSKRTSSSWDGYLSMLEIEEYLKQGKILQAQKKLASKGLEEKSKRRLQGEIKQKAHAYMQKLCSKSYYSAQRSQYEEIEGFISQFPTSPDSSKCKAASAKLLTKIKKKEAQEAQRRKERAAREARREAERFQQKYEFEQYLRSGDAVFYVSSRGLSGKVQIGEGYLRGTYGQCFFVANDGCAMIGSNYSFDGDTITCYVSNTLCYDPVPYAFKVEVNVRTRRATGFDLDL